MMAEAKMLRVVLDTNCLVSALIFSKGKTSTLRICWQQSKFIPIVCKETVTELIRVLSYTKFKLSQNDIEALLADFLPWVEIHTLSYPLQKIDELRDPDDAVFIQLAREANALYLVSGDKHLLELKYIITDIIIISSTEFIGKL